MNATLEMKEWAAPMASTIQRAHAGNFDAKELSSLYHDDAVFDDPCGTIPTPAGIVAGFEAIKFLLDCEISDIGADWSFHPSLVAGNLVLSEDVGVGGDGDLSRIPSQARLQQRAKLVPV